MTNSFLPADYKVPDNSGYMKFSQGENNFRVLSSAIVGTEYWKTVTDKDGKERRVPVRVRPNGKINMADVESPDDIKHFWAFVVYNREAGQVQILEITQRGIQTAINSLVNNPKWGDPKDYDITVTRNGEGLNTEYTVMPNPKEEIDEGITQLYKDMNINLEALYDNGDPFASTTAEQVAEDATEALEDELPM